MYYRNCFSGASRINSAGFTLLEMAFLIIIIGILTVSLLKPLSATVRNKQIQETIAVLEEAKQALIGYAALNGRLPCPDTDLQQNISGRGWSNAPCVDIEGYIPWKELGIKGYDAWGSPIRYRADNNYTATTTPPDFPETSSGISVYDNDATPNKLTANESDSNQSRVVAVIFSCGINQIPEPKNRNSPYGTMCKNETSASNGTYTQDAPTENFDDILIWIPRNVLVNRLIKSGKWAP